MKKRPCGAALLAAILVFGHSWPIHAEDFPLREYETHVHRYLASLENLAVDCSVRDYTLDGRTKIRDEFSLYSIPGHFQAKTTTTITYPEGEEVQRIEWTLLRPDGYYVIGDKGDGHFLIKEMRQDVPSPLCVDPTTPLNTLLQPVCDIRHALLRLLRGDLGKTHLIQVASFQRNPANSPTAYTLRVHKVSKGGKTDTELEFNRHWLIHRLTTTSGEPKTAGSRLTAAITYTSLGERILPARVTMQRTDPTGRALTPGFVAEFRNYRLHQGTPSDFKLAQFDLPEPIWASAIHPWYTPWYPWLVALGVVFVAMGFILRRRGQKYKGALAQKPQISFPGANHESPA